MYKLLKYITISMVLLVSLSLSVDKGAAIWFLVDGLRDNSGDQLASGQVYFYQSGTTTAKSVYTDADKGTAYGQPVTLDAQGRRKAWADDDARYKIVVKDSDSVTLYTYDDVFFGTDLNDLDGTIIGGTNAAAGSFSDLTITGDANSKGLAWKTSTANVLYSIRRESAGLDFDDNGLMRMRFTATDVDIPTLDIESVNIADGVITVDTLSVTTVNIDNGAIDVETATIITATISETILAGNLETSGYWLSNDGGDEGIYITSTGLVGINTSNVGKTLVLNNSTTSTELEMVVSDGKSNQKKFNFVINGGTGNTQNLTIRTMTDAGAQQTQLLSIDGDSAAITFGGASAGVLHSVVSIGDWNMDSTASLAVSHNLSSIVKVIGIDVIIYSDDSTLVYPLTFETAPTANGAYYLNANDINMTRATGQGFDGAAYDSTSYNRGKIHIWSYQ